MLCSLRLPVSLFALSRVQPVVTRVWHQNERIGVFERACY